MTAWWNGIPAAQTTVTCRGQSHRVRWEKGDLRALDHDDLDADRALVASGDERCICAEIVDAWAQHATNLRVLTLASRGAADPVWIAAAATPWGRPTPMSMAGGSRDHLYGGGPVGSADRDPEDPAPLLSLGGGLPARLTAAVSYHWRDRVNEREPERYAALYGRLLAALRAWLSDPRLSLELDLLTDETQPRSIIRDADTVHAALAFAWLSDVWARDMTAIAGCFTLAAAPPRDGSPWRLTTITPELTDMPTIDLTLPG
jgi:hypothetical protein